MLMIYANHAGDVERKNAEESAFFTRTPAGVRTLDTLIKSHFKGVSLNC